MALLTNHNPVGTVIPHGSGWNPPLGYLVCDGSAVSRTTYANLFNDIGTLWGAGDGSTTFNLPDLRGQFLRGKNNGSGYDPDAGSRSTGDQVGSYQGNQILSHGHVIYQNMYWGNQYTGNQGWCGDDGYTGSPTNYTNTVGGSETRPLNVYVNYCIKF